MAILNTIMYARKLEAAGVSRQQAETHLEIMAEIVEGSLATKSDIERLEISTRSLFDKNETVMRADFERYRLENAAAFAKEKAEYNAREAKRTAELDALFLQEKAEYNAREAKRIAEYEAREAKRAAGLDAQFKHEKAEYDLRFAQEKNATLLQLQNFDARVTAVGAELRHEMMQLENRLVIKLTVIMAGLIGTAAALFAILRF